MASLPRFVTKLKVTDHLPNEWRLLASLIYYTSDKYCHAIAVPKGFITDLASIPAALRMIFNPNGESRKAAVLHDWLYCSRIYPRMEADAIFREALLVCGVSAPVAWAMWAGVRAGGWLYYNRRKQKPLGADDFAEDVEDV